MRLGSRIAAGFRTHPNLLSNSKSYTFGSRCLSTEPGAGPSDPRAYCKDFVRKYDYDSYLNSYFYPRDSQNGFFALKAFSVRSLAPSQGTPLNSA
ncbi:hypothetical protein CPB84DRAFT_1774996 [Gymnopilus junonius]|uniref:Uncharacterized protein n=1 Tax=Gymnopilus junonius TaxID=109634 RepID=A0A9P5NTG4_GYMJU|nr:hypothetical protein CPB84DRAFT_1774996 [Gymnopilus junonius]